MAVEWMLSSIAEVGYCRCWSFRRSWVRLTWWWPGVSLNLVGEEDAMTAEP